MIEFGKYILFFGREDMLSNFSDYKIKVGEYIFQTGEHYYQYSKAMFFGDIETAAKIYKAPTPSMAKTLGRKVFRFNTKEWNGVKFDVMVTVLMAKVASNPIIKSTILDLGKTHQFAETTKFDRDWGTGCAEWDVQFYAPKFNWPGKNLLGKCWDEVYRQLSKQYNTTINNGQLKLDF